jgi:hypothetical protein
MDGLETTYNSRLIIPIDFLSVIQKLWITQTYVKIYTESFVYKFNIVLPRDYEIQTHLNNLVNNVQYNPHTAAAKSRPRHSKYKSTLRTRLICMSTCINNNTHTYTPTYLHAYNDARAHSLGHLS